MNIEININDSVEVVLTEFGADIYNNYMQSYLTKFDLEFERIGEGALLKSQLWSIMQLFGPHIYLGGNNPFGMCRMTILKGENE